MPLGRKASRYDRCTRKCRTSSHARHEGNVAGERDMSPVAEVMELSFFHKASCEALSL